MKKKILLLSLSAILAPIFSSCASNKAKNFETIVKGDEVVTVKKPTIEQTIPNGELVNILPIDWKDFYDDFKENHDINNLTYYYRVGVENTKPQVVDISWTNSSEDTCVYYVLYLATKKDMSDAKTYFAQDCSVLFDDLFAGTHYYYQVHAYYEDYTVISRKFDFKTLDFFRTIDIDGVDNARDIGNKHTHDGTKRTKQGLVYRSANLNAVNEKGKRQATAQLGIKTDLDLREVQSKPVSPLGENVNYINNASGSMGSPYYAGGGNSGTGIDSYSYQEACCNNIKLFADIDNYPIVFHCAVGRDRTGTLAVLLNLLCGVDLDDILLDYSMYVFTKICNDTPLNTMLSNYYSLINYLTYYIGKDNVDEGTIYDRTEEYCKDIGVSSNEIASIRNILLEENK